MATTSPPEALQGRNENHAAWICRKIWDRLHTDNRHFMGAIVGEEGSGKSYTAIRIASEIDPTFTADRVIFDVIELLKVLKDGDHEPGNFYVLDEAGVQLGRRTWQERGQVLTNQALQLIRNHNLGLIFTLPRLGELDSQAQGRLQAFLEIMEKEHGEYVSGKWKWLDPDRTDETGTIYKKYPRRRMDGKLVRVTSVAFSPPDEELTEPYEEDKTAFQNQFYQKVIDEVDGKEENGDDSEEKTVMQLADEIKSNGLEEIVSESKRDGSPYVNRDLIRAKYDTTIADSRAIKSLLESDLDEDQLEAAM